MSSIKDMHAPCATALLMSALLVASCSGSSSDPSVSQSPADEETANADVINVPAEDVLVPDPMQQNLTRVTFDISVPAYQSNALQVRVLWGEIALNADWVGDEYWTAFADFPTNTEQVLVVTFNDNDGAIALGSYETVFKTGTNAAETYQIAANQFDTNQRDDDNDGVNNLAELIAGTDPLVDESALLEVRDSIVVQSVNLVSGYYETRIPEQRPYFEHSEIVPTTGFYTDRETHIVTIDIDANGTGSFSDKYQWAGPANSYVTTRNQVATRTVNDRSIIWAGAYLRYQSDAGVGEEMDFTIETVAIDDSTRIQNGTITREDSGVSAGIIQSLTYSLTGKIKEDLTHCEPTSGTVTNDVAYNHAPHLAHTVTTISKGTDDQYWAVSVASPDGQIQEEYLIRSLQTSFICHYGDLQ